MGDARHDRRQAKAVVIGTSIEMSIDVARSIGAKVMAASKANVRPDFRFVEALRLQHGIGEVAAIAPPKQGRSTWTFEEAREAYLDGVEKRLAADTLRDYRHTLTNPRIVATLSGRLMSEIDARTIGKIILAVHDDGSERTAEKALVILRGLWKWCAHHGRQKESGVEVNILRLIEKPCRTKAGRKRAARPSVDACAKLVAACRLGVFPPAQAYSIEMLVLTAQRRRTISCMRADQVEPRRVWMIPGESIKMGLDHPIPLTPRMLEIVERARSIMSDGWLFPATRVRRIGSRFGHIHGSTITHAVSDFLQTATPHDIRRGFTTTINTRPYGAVKKPALILDHREGRTDVTGEHYDQAEWLQEKSDMLEYWSSILEPLIEKNMATLNVETAKSSIRKAKTGRGRSRKPKARPTYDAAAVRRHEMDEMARIVLDSAERNLVRGV